MKRTYISLQLLIAAKMNRKTRTIKIVAEPIATTTHYIF